MLGAGGGGGGGATAAPPPEDAGGGGGGGGGGPPPPDAAAGGGGGGGGGGGISYDFTNRFLFVLCLYLSVVSEDSSEHKVVAQDEQAQDNSYPESAS